jgi:predicted Ser/Thr protein kinase
MHGVSEKDWAAIQSLFEELVDLSPEEQAKRLARSTQPSEIVRQAEALLAAARADGILDMPSPSIEVPGTPSGYRSLAEGQVVGGFTIDRLIGRGGMGEVYLAHRTARDFEQRVALKMLRAEATDRGDLFARERRLLARLEHPGIARLIDAGIAEDGRPFMAMEYVDGEPIDAWCRSHKADLETRLNLFREVCDAVAYAHGHLVIHRDIKPSNIVIDASGKVRLLDFGIAKLLDDSAAVPIATQAMLTPDYAAPEQLDGDEASVATDVYGLGILLYELVTEQGPWRREGASVPAIIRRGTVRGRRAAQPHRDARRCSRACSEDPRRSRRDRAEGDAAGAGRPVPHRRRTGGGRRAAPGAETRACPRRIDPLCNGPVRSPLSLGDGGDCGGAGGPADRRGRNCLAGTPDRDRARLGAGRGPPHRSDQHDADGDGPRHRGIGLGREYDAAADARSDRGAAGWLDRYQHQIGRADYHPVRSLFEHRG